MPLALEMGKRDVSVSDLLHPLCCRKRECCGITAWCLPPVKTLVGIFPAFTGFLP